MIPSPQPKMQVVSIYGWTFIKRVRQRQDFHLEKEMLCSSRGLEIICLLSKTGPTGSITYDKGAGVASAPEMDADGCFRTPFCSPRDDYSAALREGGRMDASDN